MTLVRILRETAEKIDNGGYIVTAKESSALRQSADFMEELAEMTAASARLRHSH